MSSQVLCVVEVVLSVLEELHPTVFSTWGMCTDVLVCRPVPDASRQQRGQWRELHSFLLPVGFM